MVATTNLPGSWYFNHFIGTKRECENWLNEMVAKSSFPSNLNPLRVQSNKSWKNVKYRDGSKVITF